MTFFQDLSTALQRLADGESDKAGNTRLDLLVAELRATKTLDAATIESALVEILKNPQPTLAYWQGLDFLVGKLEFRSNNVAAAVERGLDKVKPDSMSRFYARRIQQKVSGSLTPKLLATEVMLKEQLPSMWLDLAFDAFAGDTVGLRDAICSLIGKGLEWTDLRKRIPRLRQIFGDEFSSTAKKIGDMLGAEQGGLWLQSIDNRYGTKLTRNVASDVRGAPQSRVRGWVRIRLPPTVAALQRFRVSSEPMYGT